MNLPREIAMRRTHEWPEPIQELALTNTLIGRIINEYAIGNIVTREEALCQMVRGLAMDCELMMSASSSVFVPPAP